MRAWLELRRLPRRVWVLSAATLINRMGTMALPFLSLYLIRAMGLTAAHAGRILFLYGIVALAVGPYAGRLADRWGAGPLMRGSLALSGLVMLAYPFATSFAGIAVMTVLWAVTTEAFRPASLAAITESAPEGMRKQTYALHRLAINLGMSLGPALGGFLAAASFKWLWWVDGATSLAAAGVLAAWLPNCPASSAAEAGAAPSREGLSDRRFLLFLLASIPVGIVFFQHEGALPVFLVRDLGYSEAFYGLLFTVNTLLIVLLEVPLNHATAEWPARRSLALGSLLFAAGFGLYGLASRTWHFAAATAVWTFGEMIQMPAMSAYVASIAPRDRQGEYMGLYLTSFSLAFTVGPWAGLLAYERWGPRPLWALTFLVGGLSAALFACLSPTENGRTVVK